MSELKIDDYRDLNDAENFVNRSPVERREAFIYFLRAGAVTPYHQRLAIIRRVEPNFIVDLHNVDFTNSPMWQADLSHANLQTTQLSWSDLRNSDLSYADLTDAHLVGADLRGANLTGAKLAGADLRGVKLDGANMKDADLTGAIEGPLTPELERENPDYRREVLRVQARERAAQSQVNTGSVGGDTYAAPKREYSMQQAGGGKGPNAADEMQRKIDEKREKKEKDLEKFQQKKKLQQKMVAKKKDSDKKFFEKKKADQAAWDKKNRK